MFFEAFIINFMIQSQVYWQRLSIFFILSFIIPFLPMSFYIKALFNPFLLLHHYCLLFCSLYLLWLFGMGFLVLMEMSPLTIRAEDIVIVGGIPVTPSLFRVVRIIVAIVLVIGNRTMAIREMSTNRTTKILHQVSGLLHVRLGVDYATFFITQHNSVHNYWPMKIKFLLTSLALMLRQPTPSFANQHVTPDIAIMTSA